MLTQSEMLRRVSLQEEYLGNDKAINKIMPLVCVSVVTYNHSKYIKECIDSILMQETSFPFEILIGDDGSTDGTTEICKEYAEKHPDKIRLFIRDRKYSHYIRDDGFDLILNGHLQRLQSRGKYHAICEGDDFWTDPLKLQKQVDFLEQNEEYSFSSHDVEMIFDGVKPIENFYPEPVINADFGDILSRPIFIALNSIVARTKILQDAPDWYYNLSAVHIGMIYYLSAHGKCFYFKEKMAAKRKNPGGVTQIKEISKARTNVKVKSMISLLENLRKYVNENNLSLLNDKLAGYYKSQAKREFKSFRLFSGVKYLRKINSL
jgi:glycosyltransferase involved in cell wall biosynthesis